MYYGKAGKGDFTPEDLPSNRRSLFFEMLRIRLTGIIRANLFYVLFWLPAIVWSVVNLLALTGVLSAEGADAASVAQQIDGIVMIYFIGMIPCIALTGPFTAGITMILRNWARDEHSFFMSDFKETVKSNWKQALGVSVITGFMPIILYICWRFYGELAATNILYILPQMLAVGMGICWLLSLTVIYSMMITYKLSFGTLIRNSIVLTIGRLPQTFLIRLVTLVVPIIAVALIMLLPIETYVLLAIALYYGVVGFGVSRFVFASYSNAVFDKYINPRIEGAVVGQGLRQFTEDDYEVDPTVPKKDDE
jgi:uncharacterized membrane protein YesL